MHPTLTDNDLMAWAQETLATEIEGLRAVHSQLGPSYIAALKALYALKGRIVVTGIGKSAIIGQKWVATFNSTGTPAMFMHAADAVHGDLGMVQNQDLVICLSQSGNSPEIQVLVNILTYRNIDIIGVTGNPNSTLAQHAKWVISSAIPKEACPHNLAPTTSTTAQLALGDALAVGLLSMKGFTPTDFAHSHPGGALGKKIYLKVDAIMQHNALPMVNSNATIAEIVLEITGKRLGCTLVMDQNKMVGIITDGDLRRMIEKNLNPLKTTAAAIMNQNPKVLKAGTLAITALEHMRNNAITQLVIVNDADLPVGIVHLHDLLREGLV